MSASRTLTPTQWFSRAELAALALPGMPTSVRRMIDLAQREGWADRVGPDGPLTRPRRGRGGGVEHHLSLLPDAAIAKLVAVAPATSAPKPKAGPGRDAAWARYERAPASIRAEAQRRLAALVRVESLVRAGLGVSRAIEEVVSQEAREAAAAGRAPELRTSTLYDWKRRVAGLRTDDRLAYLAPEYGLNKPAGEPTLSDEAWGLYVENWLRPEKPTHARCYRDLQRIAAVRGWTLPHPRTLVRRVKAEVPRALELKRRGGAEALSHGAPSLRRDRSGLRPGQVWNLDGHTWDVNVLWPDGEIGRPVSVAVQDIATSLVVGCRTDRTLHQHLVRLSLLDAFGGRDGQPGYGLPETLIMDNGRENWARSLTAGSDTRWRWKEIGEEPPTGILVSLGIHAQATQPYWGQAKPVERAFRDFAHDLAKSPRLAGAYVGHQVGAKPSNYGERAIPLAKFEAIVAEEVGLWNAREGRRGAGLNGRSFAQAWADGVAAHGEPRRPTPEQLRLCMLQSKPVRMDPREHTVTVHGHRYWSLALSDLKPQQVVARFDPEDLSKPVHVYALDGRWLCEAERMAAGSFDRLADATEAKRYRREFRRHAAKADEALERATMAELNAQLDAATKVNGATTDSGGGAGQARGRRTHPPAEPTPSNVVRPAFGAPKTAPDFFDHWSRGVAAASGAG